MTDNNVDLRAAAAIAELSPGIGHNTQIPTPKQISEELPMRFGELLSDAVSVLNNAIKLPQKITAKNELGDVSRVIIRLRAISKSAESTREAEKSPYWRGGLAVDAFFKEIIDRVEKSAVILNRRVNDYQQAQLAAERKKRDEEAAAAAKVAEEARLKADRARKADIKAAAEVQAALTERRADEAAEATQATPAGMVRERFADGPLVTMKTVKWVKIVDAKLIPLEALRPYLKQSAIEEAVKRWASVTEYTGTLAGVEVGESEESAVL